MPHNPRQNDKLHPADQKFLSDIETHGWAVTQVFRSAGETGPEWAYSTGLYHSFHHPEIIVFGLDLDIMYKVINNIGTEIKNGTHFAPGNEYQKILARYGCYFHLVDRRYFPNYMGRSIWFYKNKPFPVLQCFWPDKQGHHPWDPGCNADVVNLQPLLFELT